MLQASSGGGRAGNGPPPAPDDDHGDDDTAPAQPNWKRWLLPTGLIVGLLLSATGAVMLDNPSSAQPVAATAQGAGVSEDTSATAAETPVLSARRAPELLTRPLVEQNLVNELGDWVDRSPEASCAVVSQGSAVMFDHNGDLALPGASTQKIVTAVAALMTFGPDHRFETVAAGSDDIRGEVLAGDLYIVGGGDPLLTSEAYRNQLSRGTERLSDVADLADEIAATGVTHIQGSVIGDDSRYDDDRFHPAWPERFREQNQAGPISALNINHGYSDFPAEPAGLTARVRSSDPPLTAASVMTDLLEDRGISVDGSPEAGTAPAGVTPLASQQSRPLIDITDQMLIDSDNVTAELLFKELGLELEGEGTWEAGVTATTRVLTGAGIDLDGLDIVDGSGLSDQNLLSCDLLVEMLTQPEVGSMLVNGLAVAGETGTLAGRFGGTEVEGRLLGKTGTLRNVNALAGEVNPLEGPRITYAYVATVPDPQEITYDENALVNPLGEILVNEAAGVDIATLLPAGYPADAESPAGSEDPGSDSD